MDAILYSSHTGHTAQYADLLAKKLGLNAYNLSQAKQAVPKHADVIFFGWVRKGNIVDYKKANRRYHVLATCAVGMGVPDPSVAEGLAAKNKITSGKVFYLQGGFHFDQLTGRDRFIMKRFRDTMIPRYEQMRQAGTLEDAQLNMLKMIRDGGNAVSIDNLKPILDFCKEN